MLPHEHGSETRPSAQRDEQARSMTTDGHGLSTIAVLESKAKTGAKSPRKRHSPEGLPKVTIDGDQRQRAAHRARHAVELRALRRALPAGGLGHPAAIEALARASSVGDEAQRRPPVGLAGWSSATRRCWRSTTST